MEGKSKAAKSQLGLNFQEHILTSLSLGIQPNNGGFPH